MANWICVRAEFSAAQLDFSAIHEIFEQHGCGGTVEDSRAISGYVFEDGRADETIAGLGKALLDVGACDVIAELVPEEDWANAWKQFFKPRAVGKRLLIKPSWEDAETEGKLVIELDPGQAFGTGEHPTTRLCLEMLEDAAAPGMSVADIGCGSGVLAIAAARLGASKVYALEIEPAAAAAARMNFDINHVDVELVESGTVPNWPPADIAVSNIVSAVIIRMAPDISRIVGPGGKWILSGVIPDNWSDVLAAAEKSNFRLDEKREEDGWLGAIFSRI